MINLCPICNGSGKIKDPLSKWCKFWKQIPCRACHGKGIQLPQNINPSIKRRNTMSRNYFQIEKTEDGIFICEGKGTKTPKSYDGSKHWNDWEQMDSEKILFARIKELLDKN